MVWEQRWCVATVGRTVHVHKTAERPAAGAKPKVSLFLGGPSSVEVLRDGEVDVPRPFGFALLAEASGAETVLAAESEVDLQKWMAAARGGPPATA